jgi:4-alpha-glucanotransferase
MNIKRDDLADLATANGVATRYEDWRGREVTVDPDVVRSVLGLLDVPSDTAGQIRDGLAQARQRAAELPPTVVVRPGQAWQLPPKALTGRLIAVDEAGAEHVIRAEKPVTLPLGWYQLLAGDAQATLIVTPPRLRSPDPTWGWMLQLYALRSRRSWGIGDLDDLRAYVEWAARTGDAGAVLLNPLHAGMTVPRVQPSPYSPSSRRYANPLVLSVSATAAYQRAPSAVRAAVDALRPAGASDLIDYDESWSAKRDALALLAPYAVNGVPADGGLLDYATYCAFAERYGPNWQEWPIELREPGSPAVARERAALGDQVAFHAWLQSECQRQLGQAQEAAQAAGMPIGLVHDLAVGVDPSGADGWLLQHVLAAGVHAGAPPDAFNQLGQDWGLAAWRPDRLATTGYAAYRDVLRAVLAHAGGIRVDHVMGLWRLWWVLPGAGPDQGTYVSYDADAMVGVLALEAHRAGAVVVAEDLGTVAPGVREDLRERAMLGSEVLWFARDHEAPGQPFRPPASWPANAAASISTHDLPTAAGMLTGTHVATRASLGLLDTDAATEQARAEADRAALVTLLVAEGLIEPDASVDELIVAMHQLLGASPCRLVLASPYDVLGETRQPNLPGTVDEYPNWRIPLPASLEAICADPRMIAVADLLGKARPR